MRVFAKSLGSSGAFGHFENFSVRGDLVVFLDLASAASCASAASRRGPASEASRVSETSCNESVTFGKIRYFWAKKRTFLDNDRNFWR